MRHLFLYKLLLLVSATLLSLAVVYVRFPNSFRVQQELCSQATISQKSIITPQPPPLNSVASSRAFSKSTKHDHVYHYDLDISHLDVSNATFHGVNARAFESWAAGTAIPCANDGPRGYFVQNSTEGLYFLRPMKTGTSTFTSMQMRIATNEVRRRGVQHSSNMCPIVYGHNHFHGTFDQRNKTAGGSFLFSMLRDPTSRIVSLFFFQVVSRKKKDPLDATFQAWLATADPGHWVAEHYMHLLSTEPYIPGTSDPIYHINKIMAEYDFIGVTERLDESAVVLAMLLGVPLADILYLSAKEHGAWDDGVFSCHYLIQSFVSPGMEQFFRTSPAFQEMVRWDHILHQAVNRSLDLTIDRLGRAEFEMQLATFQAAQRAVQERCLPKAVFPCSELGKTKNTTCIRNDLGCSFDCLDEVATELQLWEPTRPGHIQSA
jgi:Sulfotransferase family